MSSPPIPLQDPLQERPNPGGRDFVRTSSAQICPDVARPAQFLKFCPDGSMLLDFLLHLFDNSKVTKYRSSDQFAKPRVHCNTVTTKVENGRTIHRLVKKKTYVN